MYLKNPLKDDHSLDLLLEHPVIVTTSSMPVLLGGIWILSGKEDEITVPILEQINHDFYKYMGFL